MSHRSAAARGAALLALAAGLLGACSSDPAAPADLTSASPDFATSATGATIVTEADVSRQAEDTPPLRSWVVYTRNSGSGTFQVGPGNVPEGVGSFGTTTPTSADKVQLFNFDYVGTPLADITALGYATWRTSGDAPNQVPAINLVVDYNGPDVAGGFTTLIFEPVYNTNQGAITDGAWQTWDAFAEGNAVWWSSKPIPGVCDFNCFVTWNTILANNPDATILGGVGVNQGSGNPALVAASDAFVFGVGGTTTTYDFEPYVTATTRDACRNDGWESVTRGDGTSFRNQGDCVSYVQTGR